MRAATVWGAAFSLLQGILLGVNSRLTQATLLLVDVGWLQSDGGVTWWIEMRAYEHASNDACCSLLKIPAGDVAT
jgi:hypothetical protein